MSYSLDVRSSLLWLCNMRFVCRIMAIPARLKSSANMPSDNDEDDRLLDTYAAQLAEQLVPNPLSRSVLSKGLQHANKLVQFNSVGLLLAVFARLHQMMPGHNALPCELSVAKKAVLYDRVCHAVAARLPDIQTVISLLHRYWVPVPATTEEEGDGIQIMQGLVATLVGNYQRRLGTGAGGLVQSGFSLPSKLLSHDLNKFSSVTLLRVFDILLYATNQATWTMEFGNSSLLLY